MEAVFFDIATSHGAGLFCKRVCSSAYFITFFETPFRYELDGALLDGDAGCMLIMEPGIPIYHGPAENAQEGFTNDWVYLRGEELSALLDRYPLPRNTPFSVGAQNLLRPYIEKVRREKSLQPIGYEEQILHMTGQLIIDLFRLCQSNRPDASAHRRIEAAREKIMLLPQKPWTLKEMASLSGYSPSRFSTLYKEKFGNSPKQDLLKARVNLAAHMLKYTNHSVSEVAIACGFQSIFYFSRYFRIYYGVSPTKYANSCRQ